MGWTKIGEVFIERNGKQCRERWYNHLDPAVNKGEWTLEVHIIPICLHYPEDSNELKLLVDTYMIVLSQEDRVLFTMQREIGNHWAKVFLLRDSSD